MEAGTVWFESAMLPTDTEKIVMHEIIENCEDRFPDEEVAEIVELVTKTLPPPPVKTKPEEITEGNEETTVKHEKGNEISEEQNEGGEQMDTS
ncbi:Rpb4/RPC9 superfamily [Sesbania bispinosa]|nr:Rpb4/RPC9 superfamily [Sesbania bispinosa]